MIKQYKEAQKINMEKNEFKDRLFDVLNDTDNLPIQDIVVDDKNNMVNVYLTDGTRFSVHVEMWVCQTYVTPSSIKAFKTACGDFHPRGRIGKRL